MPRGVYKRKKKKGSSAAIDMEKITPPELEKMMRHSKSTKILPKGIPFGIKFGMGSKKLKDLTGLANDDVNHPVHYGGKANPYETIKVMEARLSREEFIGAMKFQVYKYNDRSGKKLGTLAKTDFDKARFYQQYLVEYLERHPA